MPESSAAVRHRSKNFYGRTPPTLPTSKTELDILIERHQFIRDCDEQNLSWEDALAKKTYDQLFKELAVCDLSRWKEGKVAMRWRTASEVVDGKGHFTCANLRCVHHELGPKTPPRTLSRKPHPLGAFADFEAQRSFIPLEEFGRDSGRPEPSSSKVLLQELQTSFGYLEHGVRKLAEVKLNLCKRCAKKMNSCSLSKRRAEDRGRKSTVQASRKRDLPDSLHSSAEREPCPERPTKIRCTSAR
ncbi:hypothetical protein PTTG_02010 [Puccinia triticina 1-1 BBBD Race 1]|uniref:Uncharacterized protein n=2 Tax=Puccinia triticina TaxID=208348 RepID=A0A0C4EMM0_PUCT1|nr:uncharacterized protein PtA15_14A227 [Puccinia triticina]OAV95765.1 hypothetical protein PTTG_02010 [Puccinia triticina 1-1 BBBD Race 1]WAQ91344.1 hypothetical protein PtA15_14A227 [Puccinia triticina]WAR62147.1 hypothetical protein PtB15_14B241 [Puccinia triticina]